MVKTFQNELSEINSSVTMKIIELVVTAAVEFSAVYLGIRYSWGYERRKEKEAFHKRVTRIVPHIYIELLENLRMMPRYQTYDHYRVNSLRFKTSSWEMFKGEPVQWEEHDVIPLSRTYYNLTTINSYLDMGIERAPYNFHRLYIESNNMDNEKINEYDKWFIEKEDAKNEFLETLKDYRKFVADTDLRDLIRDTEARLIERGILVNGEES